MQFRLTAPGGHVLDEGQGDRRDHRRRSARRRRRSASRCGSRRPTSSRLTEPEPFVVRLTLAEGPSIELSKLGTLRTQILAQLADARGDEVAEYVPAGAVSARRKFSRARRTKRQPKSGCTTTRSSPSRSSGDGEKVPYPFIRAVTTDPSGYRISIESPGDTPLVVHRLARRTTEFTDLLAARHRTAARRTSPSSPRCCPGSARSACAAVSEPAARRSGRGEAGSRRDRPDDLARRCRAAAVCRTGPPVSRTLAKTGPDVDRVQADRLGRA